MTLRVGIGFSRIGRGFLRIARNLHVEVAAINDIFDAEMLACLLRLHSTDEAATTEVSSGSSSSSVNGRTIAAPSATEDARGPADQHRMRRPVGIGRT
jgi:glyceraldehyde-3-phosphate dehydrogenase/erythrose-4-phosphate dehydrogenase